MGKPLAGLKVVEVAMWAFVPAAGGMLADMGATVVKVEPPTGDPLRGLSTGMGDGAPAFDFSWESYNRGKQSITLDLRQDAGLAVLHRLLADADGHALTRLATGADAGIKGEVIADHLDLGQGRGPVADQGGPAHGRGDLAVLDQIGLGALEDEFAIGDVHLTATEVGRVQAALGRGDHVPELVMAAFHEGVGHARHGLVGVGLATAITRGAGV